MTPPDKTPPEPVSAIRILIVDDQMLVRQGIRSLLGLVAGVEVVGEAASGDEAIAMANELRPDVMLLDLRMPGTDGLGVLRQLGEAQPPTLVLTTFDEDAAMLEALRLGARGFLLKDVSLERLAEAIRAIADGGRLVQPALTERIVRAALAVERDFPALEAPDPLTERELEVLRLAVGGFSNREIAETLAMAEGTVKNHVSSILSKLGVRDRTRAVLRALELGLV
ncbi:MAG: response regulator transcription factor [Acidobacteriota bacterium]